MGATTSVMHEYKWIKLFPFKKNPHVPPNVFSRPMLLIENSAIQRWKTQASGNFGKLPRMTGSRATDCY
jgi:hypothetical protein